MAKHKKRDKDAQSETYGFGWVFYVICFLLMIGPSVYGAWITTYEDRRGLFPVIMGVAIAGVGAGVLTWAVNSIWFAIASRRYKAKRKQAKKT